MSFNAKDMTQGGQIASMRFRMFGQIANIILYVLFLFFLGALRADINVSPELANLC